MQELAAAIKDKRPVLSCVKEGVAVLELIDKLYDQQLHNRRLHNQQLL
jgi:hypothetical protein